MKFRIDPVKWAFLKDLEKQAQEKFMDVDYETMTLVPIRGFPKTRERGDNDPSDPEQAGWDDIQDDKGLT